MAITIDHVRCDRCGTCISVCVSNALLLTEVLWVDPALCVNCGACVTICPFAALSQEAAHDK